MIYSGEIGVKHLLVVTFSLFVYFYSNFRQYTMSEFPSLVIFPSTSKSDSRKFPADLPINSSNVLWFILANLTPSQRLLGLLKTCNYKVT